MRNRDLVAESVTYPSQKPPLPPAGSAVWGRPAAGALALALTGSSASERAAHAGRVVGDGFEVAFELVPGDVGGVMILDQW